MKKLDLSSFLNTLYTFEGDEMHPPAAEQLSRRAGPTSPDNKYCDVYLDASKSYYTRYGVGATLVCLAYVMDSH